jgi:hypothetical protein
MILQSTPHGRIFYLDRKEGVRLWSVRLGVGERGIRVSQLLFVGDSNASDGDEDDGDGDSGEDEPSSNKGRRRGSAKEKLGAKERSVGREKGEKRGPMPEANVRLNGALLRATNGIQTLKTPDLKPSKQWQSELPIGSNTLEVRAGEAGEVWKIFLERQAGS